MDQRVFPVIEVFGPTIQGEGNELGRHCSFVRFAHCGFSCSFCDTKYSWDAKHPDYNVTLMDTLELVAAISAQYPPGKYPQLVVLTGGDPCIQKNVEELIQQFPFTQFSVETQGQFYQPWLQHPQMSMVTISPKMSNSGMQYSPEDLRTYLQHFESEFIVEHVQLKFVCFTFLDVDEAQTYLKACEKDSYIANVTISIGTKGFESRVAILARYRVLTEYCLNEGIGLAYHNNFRITPQQHVLLWGSKKGV